ncbi:MAG: hypothetical protein LBL13_09910 [Bacteroidales bacterium]|jgi:hypothetical protein|nr:hypothetical protein [Bacteroidales bacterium]
MKAKKRINIISKKEEKGSKQQATSRHEGRKGEGTKGRKENGNKQQATRNRQARRAKGRKENGNRQHATRRQATRENCLSYDLYYTQSIFMHFPSGKPYQ